jgi:glycosyltransferase involved in cell wall biosynthesis
MEALSFGIPVIATQVGGTGELVSSENGQLLPVDFSCKELSDTIDKYMELPVAELDALRKNARETYERKVSAEKNYNSFYSHISTRQKK